MIRIRTLLLFLSYYGLSLFLLLGALTARLVGDDSLNKEEVHNLFRNVSCLENGVQPDPSATNISSWILFAVFDRLSNGSVHFGLYAKVFLCAALPLFGVLIIRLAHPHISIVAQLFAVIGISVNPILSWFQITAIDYGFDALFGFLLLAVTLRLDSLKASQVHWKSIGLVVLLSAFTLHIFPPVLAPVLVAQVLTLRTIFRKLAGMPFRQGFGIILYCLLTGVVSLWPYLVIKTRPLSLVRGGTSMVTLDNVEIGFASVRRAIDVFLADLVSSNVDRSYIIFDDIPFPAFPPLGGGLLIGLFAWFGWRYSSRNTVHRALCATMVFNLVIVALSFYHAPGSRRLIPALTCVYLFSALGVDLFLRGNRRALVPRGFVVAVIFVTLASLGYALSPPVFYLFDRFVWQDEGVFAVRRGELPKTAASSPRRELRGSLARLRYPSPWTTPPVIPMLRGDLTAQVIVLSGPSAIGNALRSRIGSAEILHGDGLFLPEVVQSANDFRRSFSSFLCGQYPYPLSWRAEELGHGTPEPCLPWLLGNMKVVSSIYSNRPTEGQIERGFLAAAGIHSVSIPDKEGGSGRPADNLHDDKKFVESEIQRAFLGLGHADTPRLNIFYLQVCEEGLHCRDNAAPRMFFSSDEAFELLQRAFQFSDRKGSLVMGVWISDGPEEEGMAGDTEGRAQGTGWAVVQMPGEGLSGRLEEPRHLLDLSRTLFEFFGIHTRSGHYRGDSLLERPSPHRFLPTLCDLEYPCIRLSREGKSELWRSDTWSSPRQDSEGIQEQTHPGEVILREIFTSYEAARDAEMGRYRFHLLEHHSSSRREPGVSVLDTEFSRFPQRPGRRLALKVLLAGDPPLPFGTRLHAVTFAESDRELPIHLPFVNDIYPPALWTNDLAVKVRADITIPSDYRSRHLVAWLIPEFPEGARDGAGGNDKPVSLGALRVLQPIDYAGVTFFIVVLMLTIVSLSRRITRISLTHSRAILVVATLSIELCIFFEQYLFVGENLGTWLILSFLYEPGSGFRDTVETIVNALQFNSFSFDYSNYSPDYLPMFERLCEQRSGESCHPIMYREIGEFELRKCLSSTKVLFGR